MTNLNNFGIVTGRLAADPVKFQNSDGSTKVKMTVIAKDAFRRADGSESSQRLPLEAFISKDAKSAGVYDLMHKGDLIEVQYSVRNNDYTDKAGEQHYDVVLFAEAVELREPKTVTDARLASRQTAQA